MIVFDTIAANTGRNLGAATRLRNHFEDIRLEKHVSIGFQHHFLYTILKHVLNDLLDGSTSSPTLRFSFISTIRQEHEQLKISFENSGKLLQIEEHHW